MRNTKSLPRLCAGLTLIELLTSLAIGATVLTLSSPMVNLVRENRATSINYEFIGALNFARSEAIKRGNRVTVCRSLSGTQCDRVPDVNGQKDWSVGWMVFSDLNGNGKFNSTQDEILRVRRALDSGYTLRSNARVRITYKSTGISPGFMDTWTVCPPGNNDALAKGVVVAYMGRARFAKDTDNDGLIDNGRPGSRRTPRNLVCNS